MDSGAPVSSVSCARGFWGTPLGICVKRNALPPSSALSGGVSAANAAPSGVPNAISTTPLPRAGESAILTSAGATLEVRSVSAEGVCARARYVREATGGRDAAER